MDSMDVLADIYTRFSSIISKNVNLQSQSLNGLTKMLVHTRVAVRKRSLVAIGEFCMGRKEKRWEAIGGGREG